MYHKHKTTKQICDFVNLTPVQLRYVLDTAGIYQEVGNAFVKGTKLSDSGREKLRKIYLDTKSVSKVAASLGITESGVYYNLRKMGLISGRWPKKVVN
jgi:hypothetical protein